MNDCIDIKEYLEVCQSHKNTKYIFMIIFFLSAIVFLGCFKVDLYYEVQGYMLDDLLVLNVNIEDLEKINNHQYLYIDHEKYKYNIYDYAEEIIPYQDQYYKTIRLQIALDEKLNADYNILQVKLELKKEVFLKIIIDKVKGEL